MTSPQPIIVWFRDDLRLSDHPALHAAANTGAPVICLYVHDEESRALKPPAARPLGGAARWWLAQSLRALQSSLGAVDGSLVLRKGAAAKIIAGLAGETGAGAVFWNEIAPAPHQAVACEVADALQEIGVTARTFAGDLLVAPTEIRNKDNKGLRALQRGQTGYPIVDAGMRELWHTGVMHNRVRMVAASLLVDWRCGEQWFWDTLVDADAGSNPANWQWVAGSGADAAPYFRVFNPTLQGEKFDPDGVYVRRWVPELALLRAGLIHQPWTATPLELAGAGVELGKTYPYPIVDHRTGRERALAAYGTIRNASMTSV
jgi:deoxyribodipyrimidine photolyase